MKTVWNHTQILVAAVAVAAVNSLPAQTNVSFADPSLEAAVRAALNQPAGPLTSVDLLSLTNLSAEAKGITDLSGLEWAGNLTNLDVEANGLTDLGPLSGLVRIESLSAGSNGLTGLNALSGLTNLNYLDAAFNRLPDIGVLLQLPALSNVLVQGNQLSLAAGSAAMSIIETLTNRGVVVEYEPQAPDVTPPRVSLVHGPS